MLDGAVRLGRPCPGFDSAHSPAPVTRTSFPAMVNFSAGGVPSLSTTGFEILQSCVPDVGVNATMDSVASGFHLCMTLSMLPLIKTSLTRQFRIVLATGYEISSGRGMAVPIKPQSSNEEFQGHT